MTAAVVLLAALVALAMGLVFLLDSIRGELRRLSTDVRGAVRVDQRGERWINVEERAPGRKS